MISRVLSHLALVYSGHVSSAELPLPHQQGLTADALLAGPRGRSLCVNLLGDRLAQDGRRVAGAWADALRAAGTGDTARCAEKLGECTRIAGLPGTPFGGGALMAGLQAAVDSARYWQEPDPEERGFADEVARAALRPVAEAVAAGVVAARARVSDVRWWTEPVDRGRQWYVQFLGEQSLPEPAPGGAADLVRAWRADTLGDERSAQDRPADPAAPYSGWWWSSPALSRLPVTTRARPGLGAVQLGLTEDGLGWESARCWPAGADDGARVYEIGGPGQWAELVERYPLDVSKSRRHDWWRVTGWAGQWLIPDYAAVAADWDAVHVTVAGYLATAGLAIPVGNGARTMLAGWDPDATWWINDVVSFTGPPRDWRRDERAPLGWTQAQRR